MDDREILERVNALVAEEHQLESRHAGEGLSPDGAPCYWRYRSTVVAGRTSASLGSSPALRRARR